MPLLDDINISKLNINRFICIDEYEDKNEALKKR